MLFISACKLFSFSRYLNFYLDFLVMYKNGLIGKVKFKIYDVTTDQRKKQLQYTYCPISQEVKTIRE